MTSAVTTMDDDAPKPRYTVIEHNGWSYVIGGPRADGGPWRYRWEAQEYADELNRDAALD